MDRVSTWATLLAVLCLLAAGRAMAARPTSPRAAQAMGRPKSAKTHWWETPRAPAVPATAREKALFALRGAYFDEEVGTPWPVDNKPKGEGFTRAPGSVPAGQVPQSEFPLYRGEIAVEAKFKSWTAYLSPSHRSIYRRIAYTIDHVLDSGPTAWRAGQEVGVLYPGGRVLLSDGRTITCPWWLPFNRFQEKTYPKPGRRYVLFLQYVPALKGYTERANIEVRHQKVVGGFYGWSSGRTLRGMPIQDFFHLIKNSISQ